MNTIGFYLANIYGNDVHSYDAFLPGVNGDGNNVGAGFANTGFVQVSGRIAPFSFLPDSTIAASFTYLRTGCFVPGSIFGPARQTAFKLQGGVDFSF